MGFKILETNKKTAEPLIGFTKSKAVTFNTSIARIYNLGEKNYLRIFVDKDGDAGDIEVGFQLFNKKKDGEKNMLTLSKADNGSCFISGNSLIRELKLDINILKKEKFSPSEAEFDGGKILVIKIPKKYQIS